MNTVSTTDQSGEIAPENLVVAYKEIRDDEVLKPSISGGAGDASLSPSRGHGHTPGAALGAVHVPAVAPGRGEVLPHHPLDHPSMVKIALSQSATDALAALGPHCLIIATMADSTAPEHAQGRMILHCLPLAKKAADDAFRVATCKARAVKVSVPR